MAEKHISVVDVIMCYMYSVYIKSLKQGNVQNVLYLDVTFLQKILLRQFLLGTIPS